jgi:hypothetical protein
MDYGNPQQRKTKKDLKRKRRYSPYKRGGAQRTVEKKEENDKTFKKNKK